MDARTARRLHRIANVGLLAAGLAMAAPYGMRGWGRWSQARTRARMEERLPVVTRVIETVAARRPSLPPPPRQPFSSSLVDIPAIRVQAVVEEGAGNWEMMLGAGHEPASAGAGGAGNCVVAAHRNMWGALFSDLPRVRPGDLVHVTDSHGTYTYQVDTSREITTKERQYLAQTPEALLTLYTCVLPYDKDRRWVVQARLVERSLFGQ